MCVLLSDLRVGAQPGGWFLSLSVREGRAQQTSLGVPVSRAEFAVMRALANVRPCLELMLAVHSAACAAGHPCPVTAVLVLTPSYRSSSALAICLPNLPKKPRARVGMRSTSSRTCLAGAR
jgi:hypothetical protein